MEDFKDELFASKLHNNSNLPPDYEEEDWDDEDLELAE